MADAVDSKSIVLTDMGVRLPPPAPSLLFNQQVNLLNRQAQSRYG